MSMNKPSIFYDAPVHIVVKWFPDPEAHCREGIARDVIEHHPEIPASRAVALDRGPGTVIAVREPEPIHEGMGIGAWRSPQYLLRPDDGRGDWWYSGDLLRPEYVPVRGPAEIDLVRTGPTLEGKFPDRVEGPVKCFHCGSSLYRVFLSNEIVWADDRSGSGLQRHSSCLPSGE